MNKDYYCIVLSRYSDPQPFYRPADMCRRSLASAVGSVQAVAAVADVSDAVQESFGWDRPAPLRSLIDHLVNAVTSYCGRDKALYAETVRCLYVELSRLDDVGVVYEALTQRGVECWVWNGDGFAAPDRVVFVPPSFMDLRPFVYGVPGEMLPYSDLLAGAGVAQTARLADVLLKVRLHFFILQWTFVNSSINTVSVLFVNDFSEVDRRNLHKTDQVYKRTKSK